MDPSSTRQDEISTEDEEFLTQFIDQCNLVGDSKANLVETSKAIRCGGPELNLTEETLEEDFELIKKYFTEENQNWDKLRPPLKKRETMYKYFSLGQREYFWSIVEHFYGRFKYGNKFAEILKNVITRNWSVGTWLFVLVFVVKATDPEQLNELLDRKESAGGCLCGGKKYSQVSIGGTTYNICRFLALVRDKVPQEEWHGSHLCGNACCINMWHIKGESPGDNGKRKACHENKVCTCGLEPKCIIAPKCPYHTSN